MPVTKTSHLSHEALPPRGKIPEVPAMSPGDAPELYTPDVGIFRDRLQVSKKMIVTNKIQTF